MIKKIDLSKLDKIKRERPTEDILSKEDELIQSRKTLTNSKLETLISELQVADKFIPEGKRQQISINCSDYTNKLIDVLIEGKKEKEGEKIKKTSYLEKILKIALENEIKKLNIKI